MLSYRYATAQDVILYFNWANDAVVREKSYNSQAISLDTHTKWFDKKLASKDTMMLVFVNEKEESIGQVRIEKKGLIEAVIGISIDSNHRGKGYAAEMLKLATNHFLEKNKTVKIHAYIKETNVASKRVFVKAGFRFQKMVDYLGHYSYFYIKDRI